MIEYFVSILQGMTEIMPIILLIASSIFFAVCLIINKMLRG